MSNVPVKYKCLGFYYYSFVIPTPDNIAGTMGYLKVFEDRESIQLKVELEELEEDRKELKNAIDLYGSDHELIRQLANLERDRTELIKKMANKI